MKIKLKLACLITLSVLTVPILSCSSLPEVKSQAFAPLKDEQTFETDFPTTWKAIEASLRQIRVISKDPSEASPLELKKLKRRSLQTDWIFSQSRTKYIDYEVNGFPHKTYLQNRFRYQIVAEQILGGVRVKVTTSEELERLTAQGASAGYSKVGEPDSSIASDLIEKINLELRSAPSI